MLRMRMHHRGGTLLSGHRAIALGLYRAPDWTCGHRWKLEIAVWRWGWQWTWGNS